MESNAVEAFTLDHQQPLGPLEVAARRAQALEREREGDALDVELEAALNRSRATRMFVSALRGKQK